MINLKRCAYRKEKKDMRKIIVLFAAGIFLINIYGCVAILAGTAGGAGTAAWLTGKLSENVNASYERTIKATKSALKSLRLEITKETRTESVTQIKSKYTDGREIWIDIRPITQSASKIDVRVGAIADKAASEKILKRITRYL
jgi:hypothetical protein